MTSDKVLQSWQETARHWIAHSENIRAMFMPVTRALIERAGIHEGQIVLDVAGGSGEPSLTIAEVVGPAGSVTCTDAVPEMVAAARAEAERRGLNNMQFRDCTADALPFADASFDVTVSRLGAMFFPDPLASMREMLRVTRPGGRVALVVWHKSEINPFCYIVTNVMARHVESPPADPDAPNAFRYAETGKLGNILSAAGAVEVDEQVLDFQIRAPISVREFWTMRSQTSDTLREKLGKLSAAEREQIAHEVEASAHDFFPGNQMNFPAKMIIVTGKKP